MCWDPTFICSKREMIKHPVCKSEGRNLAGGARPHLYETKADVDKELLARLVHFIRGLYMVSAALSNQPLCDELLLHSLLALAAQH